MLYYARHLTTESFTCKSMAYYGDEDDDLFDDDLFDDDIDAFFEVDEDDDMCPITVQYGGRVYGASSKSDFIVVHSRGCPACIATMKVLAENDVDVAHVQHTHFGGGFQSKLSSVQYIPAFFQRNSNGSISAINTLSGAPINPESRAAFLKHVERSGSVYAVEV